MTLDIVGGVDSSLSSSCEYMKRFLRIRTHVLSVYIRGKIGELGLGVNLSPIPRGSCCSERDTF